MAVKLVATALADGLSSVWMFSAPMLKRPARPVSRTPPTTGTSWPALNPIWRLKNSSGTSPGVLPACTPAKSKMPWPSMKKSRFSGKNRLKRVRLICWRSSSTCAKSVR